jgi:LysR family hydrogen peroxide-inducible transcriptional activator
MTLQQLTYLVALDTHRQFVKAAESCYVTQPTLTMQIQKLEEEVGGKLFDRDYSPISPTVLGSIMIEKARLILSEVDGLKSIVNGEVDKVEGSYTLGIIPTIAPYLIPLFLPIVAKKNKKVHLTVKEMRTDEIIQALKKGEIDMGILATPLEEKNIREWPMYYEPFQVYLSPEDPRYNRQDWRSSDLEANEMLILDEGHCFREQALVICGSKGKRKDLNFVYQSGSLEALMRLVEKGLGYTMVPALSVKGRKEEKNARSFVSPVPVREVSIVTHQSFHRLALVEWLQTEIQRVVPKEYLQAKKYRRIGWK